jgi:meiotic recombination protein SPO11
MPREPSAELQHLAVMRGSEATRQLIFDIEAAVLRILADIADLKNPYFEMDRKTTWADVRFSPSKGLQRVNEHKRKCFFMTNGNAFGRFGLILYMLSQVQYNLISSSKSTIRQVFYENVQLFRQQQTVSDLIDDLSGMLHVNRREMNILATAKGLVFGDLQFRVGDEGDVTDCSSLPVLIPNDVSAITYINSNAKLVFIIEKDATFQKMLDDKFISHIREPTILITGKGFPDVSTRELVRLLRAELPKHVHFYAVCDADPWGIEIVCVYAFGSLSRAHEDLAVPSIRWLGLHPSDIRTFKLKERSGIPLRDSDRAKIDDLMARPYIQAKPSWCKQLEELKRLDCKLEIQGLQVINPTFLCEVYLVSKMKYGGFLSGFDATSAALPLQ